MQCRSSGFCGPLIQVLFLSLLVLSLSSFFTAQAAPGGKCLFYELVNDNNTKITLHLNRRVTLHWPLLRETFRLQNPTPEEPVDVQNVDWSTVYMVGGGRIPERPVTPRGVIDYTHSLVPIIRNTFVLAQAPRGEHEQFIEQQVATFIIEVVFQNGSDIQPLLSRINAAISALFDQHLVISGRIHGVTNSYDRRGGILVDLFSPPDITDYQIASALAEQLPGYFSFFFDYNRSMVSTNFVEDLRRNIFTGQQEQAIAQIRAACAPPAEDCESATSTTIAEATLTTDLPAETNSAAEAGSTTEATSIIEPAPDPDATPETSPDTTSDTTQGTAPEPWMALYLIPERPHRQNYYFLAQPGVLPEQYTRVQEPARINTDMRADYTRVVPVPSVLDQEGVILRTLTTLLTEGLVNFSHTAPPSSGGRQGCTFEEVPYLVTFEQRDGEIPEDLYERVLTFMTHERQHCSFNSVFSNISLSETDQRIRIVYYHERYERSDRHSAESRQFRRRVLMRTEHAPVLWAEPTILRLFLAYHPEDEVTEDSATIGPRRAVNAVLNFFRSCISRPAPATDSQQMAVIAPPHSYGSHTDSGSESGEVEIDTSTVSDLLRIIGEESRNADITVESAATKNP